MVISISTKKEVSLARDEQTSSPETSQGSELRGVVCKSCTPATTQRKVKSSKWKHVDNSSSLLPQIFQSFSPDLLDQHSTSRAIFSLQDLQLQLFFSLQDLQLQSSRSSTSTIFSLMIANFYFSSRSYSFNI